MSGKTIIKFAPVFNLDVNLSHIIAAAGDGLNQKFLEFDVVAHNAADCLKGSINRTVPGFGGGKASHR